MSSNLWGSLLDSLKDVAPALATAAGTVVGGPLAGGIAGAIARSIVGAEGDKPLDEVAAEIMANPDKLLEFRGRMRDAELKELEIRTKDTADARKLGTLTKNAVVISTIIVVAFIGLIVLVVTKEIPAGSQNIAYLLIGVLAAEFSKVTNYSLGSSLGSKEKDQIMGQFMKAAQADQAARRRK